MISSHGKGKREDMLVSEVVARHKDRHLPLVRIGTPIGDLAKAIQWFRHSRQLYVVDEDGHLAGNITLGSLVRNVFASSHGSNINPRHVMGLITGENAEDIMTEGTLTARMDERIEDVLERMVAGNVEEVPVVDGAGRIIADLTMIDLLMT